MEGLLTKENRKLILQNKKRCSTCNQIKSLDDFYYQATTIGQRAYHCKKCMAIYQRNYHKKNPQKYIYTKETRIKDQVRRAKREAIKVNCQVNTLTYPEWLEVLESYKDGKKNLRCHICKEIINISIKFEFCLEHKVPLSRGGANNKENVAPAHTFCNSAKRYKTLDELKDWCQKVLQ